MNRLPKDKRDKIIIVAVGTVVVLAALFFVLIRPLQAKSAEIARLVTDSRASVEKGRRTLADTNKVATALEAVVSRLNAAEGAMAAGDLYIWMIQTMNQFKTAHKVEIPQISREIPCEVGVLPQFPYKAAMFVVQGTAYFHDLGKFIASFENNFPYMRVQNLELEPAGTLRGGKGDDNERLSFKMDIVTLVKPVAP